MELLTSKDKKIKNNKVQRVRLQGDLPNQANLSTGCPFHTRCSAVKGI
ncbi:hypothetical protein ACQKM9_07985 [Viridibacillus sp. NPDC093762]